MLNAIFGIVLLLGITVAADKFWLYAGAGGCDSDDPSCKPPSSEDVSTLYILELDGSNGKISYSSKVTGLAPNWINMGATRKFLYTVSGSGGVSSFAIDNKSGQLSRVSSIQTPGPTVFIDTNTAETTLLVASYSNGNIASYPLSNGQIGSLSSVVQFYGRGPNPDRQTSPHPHSINIDPYSGEFAYVPDLGLDTIFSFRISSSKLQNTTYTSSARVPGGSGPRHMAFHPIVKVAYVLSEMASTVTVFSLNPTTGELAMPPLQSIKTLPADFSGFSKAAEIIMHPLAQHLLVTNRGLASPSNSITVFNVDDKGMLSESGRYPIMGTFPRGALLIPGEDVLVVGAQDNNLVSTYMFDETAGAVKFSGNVLQNIATPVTFAWVPQA